MLVTDCGIPEIEDLTGHPAGTAERLRDLLSDRPNMVPDRKRLGFYEVQGDLATYYIHILPRSGKVLLLAVWPTVHSEVGAGS